MQTNVFISYAKEDTPFAERLYTDLVRAGITPWMDRLDLLDGRRWDKAIRSAIEVSDYFLPLLSSHSVKTIGFFQKEIKYALEIAAQLFENESFIIPIRIEECEPSSEEIRKLRQVDLFPDYADGLGKLLISLTSDVKQATRGLRYELEEPSESDLIVKVVSPQIILLNDHIITNLQRYPSDIYNLPPRKFEEIIADLLADQGCDVELTKTTRDGGKDIIASMNTPLGKVLTLVEAKRYAENRNISVGLVRQLYGALHDHEKATNAMFVTTSSFTADSREFEKRHQYKLSLKETSDIQNWISHYGRRPLIK